jgi:hypothetical protein
MILSLPSPIRMKGRKKSHGLEVQQSISCGPTTLPFNLNILYILESPAVIFGLAPELTQKFASAPRG